MKRRFHCSAGKDRTGVAAFLILSALQVKPAEILEDYLLTNLFFEGASATEINHLVTNDARNALADKLNSNLAVSSENFKVLERTCKTPSFDLVYHLPATAQTFAGMSSVHAGRQAFEHSFDQRSLDHRFSSSCS